MGIRENKVERHLNKEVERLGGITRKWVSPMHSGVPDRIIIYKGLVVFAEIKTLSGTLSSVQQREIDRLRQHGAQVVVLYGTEGVDNFIKTLEGALNDFSRETDQ